MNWQVKVRIQNDKTISCGPFPNRRMARAFKTLVGGRFNFVKVRPMLLGKMKVA